jgi:hypothetical protein
MVGFWVLMGRERYLSCSDQTVWRYIPNVFVVAISCVRCLMSVILSHETCAQNQLTEIQRDCESRQRNLRSVSMISLPEEREPYHCENNYEIVQTRILRQLEPRI